MSDLDTTVVATLNGSQVTLRELLKDLHRAGQLRPIISKSIVDHTIQSALQSEGIEVTTDELQKAADAFRQANRLSKAEDTQRWLQARQLTEDDLESILRQRIAQRKLIGKVTLEQIEPFFNQNRDRFDGVQLSRIVVKSDGLATEIKSQIEEDEADFYALARQYSTDARTKRGGGRMRPVAHKRLPANIESAVFAAHEGAVLGPFPVGENHVLLKVEKILPGQLNRRTAALIQRNLFRQWVRAKVAEAKPNVTIFNEL